MKPPKRILNRRPGIKGLKFRLVRPTKLLYILLIFLLSLTISGWRIEPATVKVPIFGFHDIIDLENPAEVPPLRPGFTNDYTKQDLAKFLEYLVRENYWFLTSQDLFVYFISKSKPIPPQHLGQKPVMLTFDDGYKGVHTNGLPILEVLNHIYDEKVKFVLFINPRYIGAEGQGDFLPHTSCEDLREGYSKGFYDIQSHGYAHKNLTELDAKALDSELLDSKLALRKCTSDLDKNKIIGAHIAYPYGAMNRKIEKVLPKYHLSGFLYDGDLFRAGSFKNQYRISRIPVNRTLSEKDLEKIAQGASKLRGLRGKKK